MCESSIVRVKNIYREVHDIKIKSDVMEYIALSKKLISEIYKTSTKYFEIDEMLYHKNIEELEKYEIGFSLNIDKELRYPVTVLMYVLLLLIKKDREYIKCLENVSRYIEYHPVLDNNIINLAKNYYKDVDIDKDKIEGLVNNLENKTISLNELRNLIEIVRQELSKKETLEPLNKELSKYLNYINIDEKMVLLKLIVNNLRNSKIIDKNYKIDTSKSMDDIIEELISLINECKNKKDVFSTYILLRVLKNPDFIRGVIQKLEELRSSL